MLHPSLRRLRQMRLPSRRNRRPNKQPKHNRNPIRRNNRNFPRRAERRRLQHIPCWHRTSSIRIPSKHLARFKQRIFCFRKMDFRAFARPPVQKRFIFYGAVAQFTQEAYKRRKNQAQADHRRYEH